MLKVVYQKLLEEVSLTEKKTKTMSSSLGDGEIYQLSLSLGNRGMEDLAKAINQKKKQNKIQTIRAKGIRTKDIELSFLAGDIIIYFEKPIESANCYNK